MNDDEQFDFDSDQPRQPSQFPAILMAAAAIAAILVVNSTPSKNATAGHAAAPSTHAGLTAVVVPAVYTADDPRTAPRDAMRIAPDAARRPAAMWL